MTEGIQNKQPLLAQGFQLDEVPADTAGAVQIFEITQERGNMIGIDFIPNKRFDDDHSGMVITISVGGQDVSREESIMNFTTQFFNPTVNMTLPIPVIAHGGQTITAQIVNGNTTESVKGTLLAFYENRFDTGNLDFTFLTGNKLKLKRQSFLFTIPAGSQTVSPRGGKFTIPRGYGTVGAVIVRPTTAPATFPDMSLSVMSLKLNGTDVFIDVQMDVFVTTVARRWGIFPIDAKATSTNQLAMDNTNQVDDIEVAVTVYFKH